MAKGFILYILLSLVGLPALADTAAGIAAFERGDYATAIRELKPQAERGDPAAQAKYGLILVKGLGVERDVGAAVQWFRKSAEQGHAEGQYMLGSAYDAGDVGSVDRATAAEWYRKSAEQGFAKAQLNLGDMMVRGDGIAAQPAGGAEWIRKAAEQDLAAAAHLYGRLSMTGLGIEQNALGARYWLKRAKELGVAKAATDLEKVETVIRKLETAGAPRTAGGDGSSYERAIELPEAKTELDGVGAEHMVTQYYFPDWTWKGQALINRPDIGIFDEIERTGPGGKTRKIYFNIGNWFGKLQ